MFDDDDNGTPDDFATDFKWETEGPVVCSECGRKFPMSRLDPTDSAPLCPNCKYIDWCDICGSECYCNDDQEDY